jgi:hypothetical protein
MALPELVKASPGCLGVATAMTTSGKRLIFAWFEDKKAALAWYDGGMLVRLKDEKKTVVSVARTRVRALKERLGI